MSNTSLTQLTEYISQLVKQGFLTQNEINEIATEYWAEVEDKGDSNPDIQSITQDLLKAHFAAQRTWPVPTDCDRLDKAFDELNQLGIVARQNFTCCQTCGHAEIVDEVKKVADNLTVKGYTFYHEQDTESAAYDGLLYLAYGSLDGDESQELALAQQIVETLTANDLKVSWKGSIKDRIKVQLTWQRRRIEEA